jgi:succinate-semialdehyde dehydrogenase/glutarate-semialdehyde dehydrogenase
MLESLGAKKIFDANEKFSYAGADAYFPARAYHIEKDFPQAHSEELFGPVALLFSFVKDSEAIALANQSVYGLGGALFSKDLARAEKMGRLLECGMVAINDQVKSDARMPFGGVKDSGYGRELSLYGINEFSNIKSLGINS